MHWCNRADQSTALLQQASSCRISAILGSCRGCCWSARPHRTVARPTGNAYGALSQTGSRQHRCNHATEDQLGLGLHHDALVSRRQRLIHLSGRQTAAASVCPIRLLCPGRCNRCQRFLASCARTACQQTPGGRSRGDWARGWLFTCTTCSGLADPGT